jgi:hypothetical protein
MTRFLRTGSRAAAAFALAVVTLVCAPLAAAQGESAKPAGKESTAQGTNQDPPLPPGEEVLKKVLARVKDPALRHETAQFRSVQHTQIEKFDEKGNLREREDRVYDVGPLDGGVYARLVEKNGKSLSPADLRDEQDREQRFLERSKTQRFGGGDSDRVPLDQELFDRYKGEVLRRETVNGRTAIVLRFWPRSNDLPIRRRQDYVLNKLTGNVWIDEQDWEIVKVDAHLTERVRVLLGLVANLDKVELAFEQTRVGEGVYLPLKLSAYFEGRKLFTSLHERVEVTWTGQRPAVETTGHPASAAPPASGAAKPQP